MRSQQNNYDDAKNIQGKPDAQTNSQIYEKSGKPESAIDRQKEADQETRHDDTKPVAFGGDMKGVLLDKENQLGRTGLKTDETQLDGLADPFQAPRRSTCPPVPGVASLGAA